MSTGFLSSLADDFDEDAFLSATIKFTVENLLPRSQIQLAFGDGYDDFASHDLPFHVHVAFTDEFFNGFRDIDVIPPMRSFKPKVFGQAFHTA